MNSSFTISNFHIKGAFELFRESIPVVISRFGMQLISMSAIAAVGRFSTEELAAFTLALFPIFTLILISTCLGSGLPIFAAKESAINSGAPKALGTVFRLSLWVGVPATAIGLLIALGMYCLPDLPDTYRRSAPIMAVLSLSIFGTIFHHFAVTFLQGLRRHVPSAITTMLGFIVALLFSHLFVSEEIAGMPLGAMGGAVALTFSRYVMAIHAYFYLHPQFQKTETASKKEASDQFRAVLRFGLPIALSFGIKSIALSVLTFTLGFFSNHAVAVFGVLMTLNLFLTMFPNGLAAVGAVRMARVLSLSNRMYLLDELRLIFTVHLVWVGALTVFLIIIPLESWAGLVTSDLRVLTTLKLCAFGYWLWFCGDSTIVLATGLLRALGDGWFSQLAIGGSILFFVVPAAFFLLRMNVELSTLIYLCGAVFAVVVFPILIRMRNLAQLNLRGRRTEIQ